MAAARRRSSSPWYRLQGKRSRRSWLRKYGTRLTASKRSSIRDSTEGRCLIPSDSMLTGLLVTIVLAVALWARRCPNVEQTHLRAWREPHTGRRLAVGGVLAFATSAPACWVAYALFAAPPTFWADESTHAQVAAEVVARGLPHGWIAGYFSGFPIGHHYPIGGWAILSALIAMGCSPAIAVSLVGLLATTSIPVLVYFIAIRAGARASVGFAGAAFVSWVSPYNPFVGGYEVYYQLGLLSQILGTVSVLVLGGTVILNGQRWHAPVAAAMTMLLHPQLAVAAGLVLAVAVLASGNRTAMKRGLRAGAALVCAGGALYGQGISTLRVPFGWPPNMGWRHLGFHPSRLVYWLVDGDLLDLGRAPVLTAVGVAALAAALLRPHRSATRAAALSLFVALLLSVSGSTIAGMGQLGQLVLTAFQPLRFVALVPLVCAALVVVSLEEWSPLVDSLVGNASARLRRISGTLPAAACIIVLLGALPSRWEWAQRRTQHLATLATQPCGAETPAGYERARVHGALRGLRDGSLWYEGRRPNSVAFCAISDALDSVATVPIAHTAGVGSHVGLIVAAMDALRPAQQGSDARAEALGVRYLLLDAADPIASGWHTLANLGPLRLYTRTGRTDQIGVGCIREAYSGSDQQLRVRLETELARPVDAPHLLDPTRLVALESSEGQPRASAPTSDDTCSVEGARIIAHPREPGALQATVELRAPADVVFRATAFPAWRASIDGQPAPIRIVAPGFFSVRVPRGQHEVSAVVSLLPWYWLALALGALGVAACCGTLDGLKALARRR